jgi:hypothetical protein
MKNISLTSLEKMDSDIQNCLVLMPFNPESNHFYNTVIVDIINMTGLIPKRKSEIINTFEVEEDSNEADYDYNNDDEEEREISITEKESDLYWDDIIETKVIIADVSDQNPCVFFELGLAHAIGKQVIFITQKKNHLPFDTNYIPYSLTDRSSWATLQYALYDMIKTILGN